MSTKIHLWLHSTHLICLHVHLCILKLLLHAKLQTFVHCSGLAHHWIRLHITLWILKLHPWHHWVRLTHHLISLESRCISHVSRHYVWLILTWLLLNRHPCHNIIQLANRIVCFRLSLHLRLGTLLLLWRIIGLLFYLFIRLIKIIIFITPIGATYRQWIQCLI